MNGMYINWTEKNEFGIPIIDEQHRGLVSAVNTLYVFMRHKKGKIALGPIISTFEQYIRLHFFTEEALLRLSEFPGAEDHRKSHRALLKTASQVIKESRKLEDAQQLLSFLKTWWLDHINEEDRAFAPHVVAWMKDKTLADIDALLNA